MTPRNGCFMVHIPALGRHNVANALAAYCAASQLGLTPKEAIRLMKEFRQTGMRQQMMDSHGVRIIQDCYNANPNSMQAALEMFKEYPLQAAPSRCWPICWSWGIRPVPPMRSWAAWWPGATSTC